MTSTTTQDDNYCDLCVTCHERPWGFGYCGEECAICAAQA